MAYSKLCANKYQSQQIKSSSSIMIMAALCEKAMSFILSAKESLAKDDQINWTSNLSKVHNVIDVMISSFDEKKGGSFAESLSIFYLQLSLFTNALISKKLPSSKVDDLLESFRITRDSWNDMEKRYIMESTSSNFGDKNTL